MIETHVTGKTKVYGLLGNPVEHSLSPQIHNTLAKKMNLDAIYIPFPVSHLENAVAGAYAMGVEGLNITIPFKKDILPFLTSITKDALEVGAVNTLVRTEGGFAGYNTDVSGVMKTLHTCGVSVQNEPVILLGAGGAAYAAAVAVARLGASKLVIVNRSNKNAENLAYHLNKYYNIDIATMNQEMLAENKEDYALFIQTTSVGMDSSGCAGQSPVHGDAIVKQCRFVFDMIYAPAQTPLLTCAKKNGSKTVNGYPMLFYQALAAFERWHGVTVSDAIQEAVMQEIGNAYGLLG